MERLKILVWHVHGAYLNALLQVDQDWYLPVKPDQAHGYVGKGWTFDTPPYVREVPADRVRDLDLDLVIYQNPRNYGEDAAEILSAAQRRLPAIYVEHNAPRPHPTDSKHPIDDPTVLLVHVTPYNELMWDNGRTPTVVIEHSVAVDPAITYRGDLARGVVVVNEMRRRGRATGYDLFLRARERVPLDLIGMQSEALGGLGDVPYRDLHRLVAGYRFLFSPMRYTSLPLAVIEAMTIGMPVVALATTAVPDAIEDGEAGYVSCDIDLLVARMQTLLADPAEAHRLGANAREVARRRFGLDRFRRDWNAAFARAIELRPSAGRNGHLAAPPIAVAAPTLPADVARSVPESREPVNLSRRVAMVSEHASPAALLGGADAGGQNVYVDALSRQLGRLGLAVDIFVRRDHAEAPEVVDWAAGVRIVNLPAGPPHVVPKDDLWPFMPAFRDALLGFRERQGVRYDVVHGNFWMSGWVAAELRRELRIPAVQLFHALGTTKRRHQGAADTSPADRIGVERRVVAEVDRVIAQCPNERAELRDDYGASPDNIALIPAGVDTDIFRPVPREVARRQIGLDVDGPLIVYVGRLLPRKDIRNVVRAIVILNRRWRDAGGPGRPPRLLVVGGETAEPDAVATPEIGALQRLAAELGVAGQVQCTGQRAQRVLRHYYGAGDVAVTTPWYEPFGLTPPEAMACVRPVVGSAVGGIAFTVQDGVTGYLVPPGDPEALADRLHLLLTRPDLGAGMGRAAQARVEREFTWPTVARRVAALYEELLAPADRATVAAPVSPGAPLTAHTGSSAHKRQREGAFHGR